MRSETAPGYSVRGPRARVRAIEAHDQAAFLDGANRSTALHGDWVSPPRDPEAFRAYLARLGPSFLGLGAYRLDGALAGVFNLSQIAYGSFLSAYLGFYCFAGNEGRGFMGDGLDLVLHVVFERLGLHRVEANVQPTNEKSLSLVARHGFVREGFSRGYLYIAGAWRDHERWAIRREIWAPRPDTVFE